MKKINVPMALMSLVVSILLWANIYNFSKNPTKTAILTLSLDSVGLDDSKYVVTEMPSVVSITVAGTRNQLSSVSNQNTSAMVELGSASAGVKTYPVQVFPVALRELLVSSGLTARLKIDQLVTKELPVVVKRIGASTDKAGFQIDTFPQVVFATGPSELIRRASSAVVSTEFAGAATSQAGVEIQPVVTDADGKVIAKLVLTAANTKPKYNESTLSESFLVRVRVKPATYPGLP